MTQLDLWPQPERRRVKRNALSPVEADIMRRIASGAMVKEVTYDLHSTKGSVDQTIVQLRRRFNARTTPHLVAILVKRGLI